MEFALHLGAGIVLAVPIVLIAWQILRVVLQQPPRDATPQDDQPQASDDTVDFLLDYTKDIPNVQFDISDKLDTKMYSVFAAATVAIGLASRLPTNSSGALGSLCLLGVKLVDLFFYLAVISYALVLIATVLHLRTKEHRGSMQVSQLWEKHRAKDPHQLKRLLIEDISGAYTHNLTVLKRKARTVNCSVWATGLEGLYIVIALILSR